jgi:hypothetical protein
MGYRVRRWAATRDRDLARTDFALELGDTERCGVRNSPPAGAPELKNK